ncbi:MAG: leucine-rich repeat protein [Bacteroidales bacterium]|jgi:hypothetical protein|nr:leucine-rich repeat protein [Bacteroidales bacterium]
MMKKHFYFLIWQLLFVAMSVNAQQTWPIGASTNIGGANSVLATLSSSTGELTISGSGAMINWVGGSNPPWYDVRTSIKTVIIEDGVTSIGDEAFYGCVSLTSATISGTVARIGDYAFYECETLASIVIPNGVIYIGVSAFMGCSALTSVNIPGSVTLIERDAFLDCGALSSIEVAADNLNYSSQDGVLFNKDKTTLIRYPEGKQDATYAIPNSVETIENFALWGAVSLTAMTIPQSVTHIGNSAFAHCWGLTSVVIPDNVAFIEGHTFFACIALVSVTIPEGITHIGDFAFAGCIALTSVTIPNSVIFMGQAVFANCTALASVTISNNLETIDHFTFENCAALTSVVIPEGVKNIGNYAFVDCTSLVSLSLPSTVAHFGNLAFANCSSLTSITYLRPGPPTIMSSVFQGVDKQTCCLYVLNESVDVYTSANIWRDFACIAEVNPQTTPTDTIRLRAVVTEHDLTACMGFGVTSDKSYGISWGDGIDSTYHAMGTFGGFVGTHQYALPGVYEVKIFGKSADALLQSVNFNSGSCTYLGVTPINVIELDVSQATHIEYLTCTYNRNLTSLDLRPLTNLIQAHVEANALTELHIDGLSNLALLNASFNKLTTIDIGGLASIASLRLQENRLTTVIWDDQTAMNNTIAQLIGRNQLSLNMMDRMRRAGTSVSAGFNAQLLPNREVDLLSPISLAADTLIANGSNTIIRIEGEPFGADPAEYYTLVGDQLTFLKDGYYEVILTHSSLPSTWVVIPFIAGDVETEEITFTIDGSYAELGIYSNSGMAPISIAWGDGDTSVYFGHGYTSHHYPHAGSWTATITILDGNFNQFAMVDSWQNNRNLVNIDFSQAPNMEGVFMSWQTKLLSLDLSMCPLLTTVQVIRSGLTDINLTGLTALKDLEINHNQLETIDLSGLSALDSVKARNNKITEIFFDNATNFSGIEKYDFDQNALSLPNIYKVATYFDPNKGSFLNQQFRRTETTNIPISLSADTILVNAIPTNIVVKGGVDDVEEGFDYTLSEDVIEFLSSGIYGVTLTHEAIPNADVMIVYVVGNVEEEEISFTFTGTGYILTLFVSSDQGTVTVDWGDGETSTFTGSTEYRNVRKPTYPYVAGTYTVNIKATPGVYITRLMANDWAMFDLDVSKARSLTQLLVPYNNLTSLDLSTLRHLNTLLCDNNQLTDIDLTGCIRLETLGVHINSLTQLNLDNITSLQRLNAANNRLSKIQMTNSSNLFEVNASNNLLPLSNIHTIAKILNTYTGSQTIIGNFDNQQHNTLSVNVGEEYDFASELLTVGSTAQRIAGATYNVDYTMSGNNIIFLKNGNYILTLTHDSINYQHNVIIPFTATGETNIKDIERFKIKVYPNPVTDILYIETNDFRTPHVRVYNLTGKLVLQAQTKELNMSNLPQGVYMVWIDGQILKVVK